MTRETLTSKNNSIEMKKIDFIVIEVSGLPQLQESTAHATRSMQRAMHRELGLLTVYFICDRYYIVAFDVTGYMLKISCQAFE